jgi:Protein of unknown function (DUF3501)
MRPLTLDDLLPLEEYVGRRPEIFATQSRYLDRYRRVRVGPKLTLVFENRQTLWFRVQEVVRVARLADPLRVQQELDWYNRLLPGRDRLQAALVIDAPEGPDWIEQWQYWQEFTDDAVRLIAGEEAAPAVLVTCRPEDRAAGAAHWLEFALSAEARQALADQRRPAYFAADYRTYRHQSQPLSPALRQSLLDDLEMSDRDRQ